MKTAEGAVKSEKAETPRNRFVVPLYMQNEAIRKYEEELCRPISKRK